MEHLDTIGEALAELSIKYAEIVKNESTKAMDADPKRLSGVDEAEDTSSPSIGYSKVISINVGGRKYQTSPETLRAESGLFRHQLSDCFTWTPESDGSYFLDADPELFEHLLRFMRRPDVFPLFYTKSNGFDYGLYSRLEAEAEYFQIDALHQWIKEKRYQQVVKVKTGVPTTRNIVLIEPSTCDGNTTEKWHVIPRTRQVYVCPRQIGVHQGDPSKCGLACRKAQGDSDAQYDEVAYTEVAIVEKTIEFDGVVCRLE